MHSFSNVGQSLRLIVEKALELYCSCALRNLLHGIIHGAEPSPFPGELGEVMYLCQHSRALVLLTNHHTVGWIQYVWSVSNS